MHIRAMHRRVTSSRPTPALSHSRGMRNIADVNLTRRSLHLRMALQTKIRVALDQQLSIHRPVRVVTHRATLPQRFMLEDKWPRLLSMTLRAILVQPRHRQSGRQAARRTARRLEYVAPMRIVALNAIHMPFDHRMMLRHSKFSFRLQMTLKTRRRILSRVHNELPATAARFDMLAPRPMTRFATGFSVEPPIFHVHAPMWTRRKNSRDVRVTLRTRAIPHVPRSRNFRRRNYRPSQCRTGYCQEHNQEKRAESEPHSAKSM
jgi:hypothetical protein